MSTPPATLHRSLCSPLGLAFALALAGCAVPISHQHFSIPAASGKEGDFASTRDLRVAGLTAEAMSYSKRGRFFEAESRLRQADYLTPRNERIEYNLAVAMNQNGESEDAKLLLEELLRRKPNDPNLLAALADVEFSLGEAGASRAELKSSFKQFRDAGNAPQAARLARSISNLAWMEGNEQEALCYSFEAWTLGQNSEQLAWHARLLVALNLFREAKAAIEEAGRKNKGLVRSAPVQLAQALAQVGLGDYQGAGEAAEVAADLSSEAPEMGAEISTATWLISQRLRPSAVAAGAEEIEAERLEGVVAFRDRVPHELVTWPPELRQQLDGVQGAE